MLNALRNPQSLLKLSALAAVLAVPASAQDQASPPSPPSVQTADAPLTTRSSRSRTQPAMPEVRMETVFVRVLGGDKTLWSGDLSMANYRGANVTLNVQDVDPRCPIEDRNYAMRRNGVQLRVNPIRQQFSDRYRINVTWTRPSKDCAEQGSRSIGFELQVDLAAGETKTLEGDGGLSVEVTRKE